MKGNEIMKKTMIKRMLSTASSAIMVSAMAASALNVFAANTPNSGNQGPDNAKVLHAVANASDLTFTIKKDIVIFNEDALNIFEPNVDYTYTVAPANVNDGTTITGLTEDADDGNATVTVAVRAGVAGGVTILGTSGTAGTTATLKFGDDTAHPNESTPEADTVTVANAKTVDKDLTISINEAAFNNASLSPKPTAGVYRYVITDTTDPADLIKAGIDRNANYDEARYLDVYTKYDNDGNLKVYGYVLLKANDSIAYSSETGVTETIKVTGFDKESETDGTHTYENGNTISDQYHTYNVDITKTVDGALGDKNHEFPFKIELTNETVTSEADFYYKHSTASTPTDVNLADNGEWTYGSVATASGTTYDLKLKHGESFSITGLPKATMIKVTELNDTPDTYSVSALGNTSPLSLNSATPAKGQTAAMTTEFDLDETKTKDTIAFTNTLKDISVTGIAFTAAPFALMLLAGTFFVGMFMKNRKKDENENVI